MRNSNIIWKKSSKAYANGRKIFARKKSEATKEESRRNIDKGTIKMIVEINRGWGTKQLATTH